MPPRKNTGAPTRPASSRVQATAATAAKRKADEAALKAQQSVTKRQKLAPASKKPRPKTPTAKSSSKRAVSTAAVAASTSNKKTVISTNTKSAKTATPKPKTTKITLTIAKKGGATTKSSQTKSTPKSAFKFTSKATKKDTAKTTAPSAGVQKTSKVPDSKAALAKKRRVAAAKAWATRRANANANTNNDTAQPNTSTPAQPAAKPRKPLPVINHAPTQVLDVFVCGAGENGELGLGTGTQPSTTNVRRPRLNPLLAADRAGVVQIATGGMHCAALTKDGKILTWGVNDDGALGRGDTATTTAMAEQAANDPNHNGLNANECIPAEIPTDRFPPGTVITKVAAGDSITLALTAEGLVFGWGLFRDNNGEFGFSRAHLAKQEWPVLIEGLSKVVDIACGDNHCLALTAAGKVLSWGAYEQSQLGRRVVERHRLTALRPAEFGLGRTAVKRIFSGCYHSFALDGAGRVWAWGLNNCGQTGIRAGAGLDGAVVQPPALVTALAGRGVVCIKGGSHHSIALCAGGEVLTWGKGDGCQLGVALTGGSLDLADTLPNQTGAVGVVLAPQVVGDVGEASWVTCGTDHCIALTPAGRAYAWGMATSHQTGLGQADMDVERPECVDNSAVRGRKLTWAGAGGQFSVFTSPAAQSGA